MNRVFLGRQTRAYLRKFSSSVKEGDSQLAKVEKLSIIKEQTQEGIKVGKAMPMKKLDGKYVKQSRYDLLARLD